MTEIFDRAYWEDRYGAPGHTWSGRPNAVLVEEASALKPGRALDIGSGEGGDAIWLAQQGWTVTGTDISQNALDKAAARAASVGVEIQWWQRDLGEWMPEPLSFDLVTSHFMHLPAGLRTTVYRALAAAVAPGGSLLIVGHDPAALEGHDHRLELMFTVDDVLADIADSGLQVQVAESRPRSQVAADGTVTAMSDIVVRAQRTPS